MDKTFLGILNTSFQELEKANDEKGVADILFKIIKLLLGEIKFSSDVLNGYNEIELRRLFSFYGKVAQFACDFYAVSKDRFDPETLKTRTWQNLELVTQEAIKINVDMQSFEEANINLLKKEKELNDKYSLFISKKNKIAELEETEKTVTDDVLTALDKKEATLKKSIERNQHIKNELTSKIKKLENVYQALQDSFVRENTKEKLIEEDIIETIKIKFDTIKEIYYKNSKDLDNMITEVECLKKQYEQLPDKLAKAKENQKFYNLHLGENSNIVSKLKGYGIFSIGNFLNETERLKIFFESELIRFDRLIRDVITEHERVKKEIDRRIAILN